MHLKLDYHRFKRDCNKHELFYVSFMVTNHKAKLIVDTQKTRRKEYKKTTIESPQSQKQRAREGRNEGITKQPQNDYQNGN